NPGRLENGRGLVLEKLDPSSPYHSASEGVDKSAVVRDALRVADTVAFAGDGPTDLQPALLVRPGLRFARGFLAEALRARGGACARCPGWGEIERKRAEKMSRLMSPGWCVSGPARHSAWFCPWRPPASPPPLCFTVKACCSPSWTRLDRAFGITA